VLFLSDTTRNGFLFAIGENQRTAFQYYKRKPIQNVNGSLY